MWHTKGFSWSNSSISGIAPLCQLSGMTCLYWNNSFHKLPLTCLSRLVISIKLIEKLKFKSKGLYVLRLQDSKLRLQWLSNIYAFDLDVWWLFISINAEVHLVLKLDRIPSFSSQGVPNLSLDSWAKYVWRWARITGLMWNWNMSNGKEKKRTGNKDLGECSFRQWI